MKYIVLYTTIINKVLQHKNNIIEFDKTTDEGYIKRLIFQEVIKEYKEETKSEIKEMTKSNPKIKKIERPRA